MLANWAIHRDVPWDERVAGWVPDGCAALVVQREVLDPAAYVELWLKDEGLHGGPDYLAAVRRVARLARRAGHRGHRLRLDQRPPGRARQRRTSTGRTPSSSPIAPAIRDWGAAAAHPLRERDHLTLRVDVVQETTGQPGAEDPETIVLRQQRGLRRARQVDTVEAAIAGRLRRRAVRSARSSTPSRP